jgi:prepilin-type N-terminal cleavage/methylation domain-containing protein
MNRSNTLRNLLRSVGSSQVTSASPSRHRRLFPSSNNSGPLDLYLATASKKRPSGFTITELLVTIAIISVLAALLVPAVQSARESARRTECLSHLSQIGKALHSFESTHRTLPEAGDTPGPPSAHAKLLPFLEQTALYEQLFNLGVPTYGLQKNPAASNQPHVLTPLPFLQCPSDFGQGLNNYAYCIGPTISRYSMKRHGTGSLGAFGGYNTPLSLSAITDGLSYTAAASERLRGGGNPRLFDRKRDTFFSGIELIQRPVASITIDQMSAICGAAEPVVGQFTAFDNATWAYPTFEGAWYNHAIGPNSQIPNCSTLEHGWVNDPVMLSFRGLCPPRSWHRASVNLLMMDGSARAVSDSIDIGVWRAIATCQGGETIGEF